MFNSKDFNKEVTSRGNGKKYEGVVAFKPAFINPTLAELKSFYGDGYKKDEEFKYQRTDKNGDNFTIFNVYGTFLSPSGEEIKAKLDSFFLYEKEFSNKVGDKKQFIDPLGNTKWLTKEAVKAGEFGPYFYLPEGKKPRVARKGEENLMAFVLKLMGFFTYYNKEKDTIVPSALENGEGYLKVKELLAGNYSSLQSLIKEFCTEKTEVKELVQNDKGVEVHNPYYMRQVACLAYVGVNEEDGKLTQGLSNEKFGAVAKSVIGEYAAVPYDVKAIVKAVEEVVATGYGPKIVGKIVTKLQEYEDDGVNTKFSDGSDVESDDDDDNTTDDDSPFTSDNNTEEDDDDDNDEW